MKSTIKRANFYIFSGFTERKLQELVLVLDLIYDDDDDSDDGMMTICLVDIMKNYYVGFP